MKSAIHMLRLAILLALILQPYSACYAASRIPLFTGPKTGTYAVFGRNIADAMAQDAATIEPVISEGSLDNIQKLQQTDGAGLAIVQSDILGFLKRSYSPQSQALIRGLYVMSPLYHEEVHVLARHDIESFSELEGKRIAIGEEGSGHMMTAMNLLSIAQISPAELQKVSPEEGIVSVLQGRLDAVIFVGGKPVKIFKNMEDLTTPEHQKYALLLQYVHFLPLNDSRFYDEYEPTEITAKDYQFVKSTIPTISVQAALVSHHPSGVKTDEEHCAPLKNFAEALQRHLPELQQTGHSKWHEVALSSNLLGWEKDPCLRQ